MELTVQERCMSIAIKEAWKAFQKGEVPVGAVIISSTGNVVSKAHNETIRRHDPTAHAEILALRKAGKSVRNYRLLQTKIYVTIEPCIMCTAALIHARVDEIVFGVPDPKWGGLQSLYRLGDDKRLNHQIRVISGVLESECRGIIQAFFAQKRKTPQAPFLRVSPLKTEES